MKGLDALRCHFKEGDFYYNVVLRLNPNTFNFKLLENAKKHPKAFFNLENELIISDAVMKKFSWRRKINKYEIPDANSFRMYFHSEITDQKESVITVYFTITSSEYANTKLTYEQRLQLEEQVRKFVQLVTQSFLLSHGNPDFEFINKSSKQILIELRDIALQNAMFSAHNLTDAIDIVKDCENIKESHSDFRSNYQKGIPHSVKKIIFNSKVFMYPELLPPHGFIRKRPREKEIFTKAEDNLIAIGLEKCSGILNEALIYIHTHLLPCKKIHQIKCRIKNLRASKSPKDNPVKYYYNYKEAPPICRYVQTFDPSKVKAPKDYAVQDLPHWLMHFKNPKSTKTTPKIIPRFLEQLFILPKPITIQNDNIKKIKTSNSAYKLPFILPKITNNNVNSTLENDVTFNNECTNKIISKKSNFENNANMHTHYVIKENVSKMSNLEIVTNNNQYSVRKIKQTDLKTNALINTRCETKQDFTQTENDAQYKIVDNEISETVNSKINPKQSLNKVVTKPLLMVNTEISENEKHKLSNSNNLVNNNKCYKDSAEGNLEDECSITPSKNKKNFPVVDNFPNHDDENGKSKQRLYKVVTKPLLMVDTEICENEKQKLSNSMNLVNKCYKDSAGGNLEDECSITSSKKKKNFPIVDNFPNHGDENGKSKQRLYKVVTKPLLMIDTEISENEKHKLSNSMNLVNNNKCYKDSTESNLEDECSITSSKKKKNFPIVDNFLNHDDENGKSKQRLYKVVTKPLLMVDTEISENVKQKLSNSMNLVNNNKCYKDSAEGNLEDECSITSSKNKKSFPIVDNFPNHGDENDKSKQRLNKVVTKPLLMVDTEISENEKHELSNSMNNKCYKDSAGGNLEDECSITSSKNKKNFPIVDNFPNHGDENVNQKLREFENVNYMLPLTNSIVTRSIEYIKDSSANDCNFVIKSEIVEEISDLSQDANQKDHKTEQVSDSYYQINPQYESQEDYFLNERDALDKDVTSTNNVISKSVEFIPDSCNKDCYINIKTEVVEKNSVLSQDKYLKGCLSERILNSGSLKYWSDKQMAHSLESKIENKNNDNCRALTEMIQNTNKYSQDLDVSIYKSKISNEEKVCETSTKIIDTFLSGNSADTKCINFSTNSESEYRNIVIKSEVIEDVPYPSQDACVKQHETINEVPTIIQSQYFHHIKQEIIDDFEITLSNESVENINKNKYNMLTSNDEYTKYIELYPNSNRHLDIIKSKVVDDCSDSLQNESVKNSTTANVLNSGSLNKVSVKDEEYDIIIKSEFVEEKNDLLEDVNNIDFYLETLSVHTSAVTESPLVKERLKSDSLPSSSKRRKISHDNFPIKTEFLKYNEQQHENMTRCKREISIKSEIILDNETSLRSTNIVTMEKPILKRTRNIIKSNSLEKAHLKKSSIKTTHKKRKNRKCYAKRRRSKRKKT